MLGMRFASCCYILARILNVKHKGLLSGSAFLRGRVVGLIVFRFLWLHKGGEIKDPPPQKRFDYYPRSSLRRARSFETIHLRTFCVDVGVLVQPHARHRLRGPLPRGKDNK